MPIGELEFVWVLFCFLFFFRSTHIEIITHVGKLWLLRQCYDKAMRDN